MADNENLLDKMREHFAHPENRISVPLCGKCGQQHDPRNSECPPTLCQMCGTMHKPGDMIGFPNCDYSTEQFKRKYKSWLEWQQENTRQIWNQPDKEKDENEEEENENAG